MQTITDRNYAAVEPLTALNADEPLRYVGCNLTNRLVHPDSEVVDCQVSQHVRDSDDAHNVGVGVHGEVTAAMVQAVRDSIGGES